MKTLADQLSDLSDRTKKTQDLVSAVLEKDRATLVNERKALRKKITRNLAAVEDRTDDLGDKIMGSWRTLRSSVDDHFTQLVQDTERRRTKTTAKKVERHALRAEAEAAAAVGLAVHVLDRAEYAALEAAIARSDADAAALAATTAQATAGRPA